MGQTKQGALQARDTNYELHGKDFYRRIGAKGGRTSRRGGFFANRELASACGKIGGKISKRGKRLERS